MVLDKSPDIGSGWLHQKFSVSDFSGASTNGPKTKKPKPVKEPRFKQVGHAKKSSLVSLICLKFKSSCRLAEMSAIF